MLSDEDTDVVLAGIAALTAMKHAGGDALPAVVRIIEHDQPDIRSEAIKCFAAIEADKSRLVPVLITALNDADWTVRRAAAESLGAIGSAAKAAVPVLFEMLKSEEDTNYARGALRAIDAAGPEAVPVLMAGLESDDQRSRFYALFLLGKVGPAASEALPLLKKLMEETESGRMKDSFQKAIEEIEAKPRKDGES